MSAFVTSDPALTKLQHFLQGIRRKSGHLILDNGALELKELSADPDAPTAGRVRIYAKDNGSGKTGLYARFPTGAVQQIALEP